MTALMAKICSALPASEVSEATKFSVKFINERMRRNSQKFYSEVGDLKFSMQIYLHTP